jgi:hypothetical protein
MIKAVHADLLDVKAQVTALADCLDGIAGRGPMEPESLRGLSFFAWCVVEDIDRIQRQIETLADTPPRRSGRG